MDLSFIFMLLLIISHYNVLRSLMRITEKHLISHSGLNGNKYFDELSQTTTGGGGG